jgi:hypothetical protein
MNKQIYDKIKIQKIPINAHDNYSITGYYGNSLIITLAKTQGEWCVMQQMDGATILNNEQMSTLKSSEIIALVKVRAFNEMRHQQTEDELKSTR